MAKEKSIARLQTIPGIGLCSACWLVTVSLNFTACTRAEQLVQYAALAPTEPSSGSSVRGHSHLGAGGHLPLGNMLYMAAQSARRFHPILQPFYEQLIARGKARKVALGAIARKLIHLAFALVKNGTDAQADYLQKGAVALSA